MTEQGSTAILQPGTRADIGAVSSGVGSVAPQISYNGAAPPALYRCEQEAAMACATTQDDVPYLSTACIMGSHIWSEPGSQAMVRMRSDGIPSCTRTIRLFLRKRD